MGSCCGHASRSSSVDETVSRRPSRKSGSDSNGASLASSTPPDPPPPVASVKPPQMAPDTRSNEEEVLSDTIVCSATTVDEVSVVARSLAESTWPEVSMPTASVRYDHITHAHTRTGSEFDSEADFSPVERSMCVSPSDLRRSAFVQHERERAAVRELLAMESGMRRAIMDFVAKARHSLMIRHCRSLLALERRAILVGFFQERAERLLSAAVAQEALGRRALEIAWHALLLQRIKQYRVDRKRHGGGRAAESVDALPVVSRAASAPSAVWRGTREGAAEVRVESVIPFERAWRHPSPPRRLLGTGQTANPAIAQKTAALPPNGVVGVGPLMHAESVARMAVEQFELRERSEMMDRCMDGTFASEMGGGKGGIMRVRENRIVNDYGV